jgi:cell division protein FtsN
MKDYKPRPKARRGGSTLVGIFVGLLLGLAIAAAIAIYMTNTPMPFVNKQRAPDRPPMPPAATPGKPAAPGAPTVATAPTAAEKPKFDFYKILPGQEEPVTERQVREAQKAEPKPGAPKETYVIQVGAFQNPSDADNLKAKLALMGLEATIEPAALADKGTWYRVRLGPYARLDDINRVRSTLAQNGVDAQLVKLKDVPRQN